MKIFKCKQVENKCEKQRKNTTINGDINNKKKYDKDHFQVSIDHSEVHSKQEYVCI
jgi:hypothetical protein